MNQVKPQNKWGPFQEKVIGDVALILSPWTDKHFAKEWYSFLHRMLATAFRRSYIINLLLMV